MFRSRSFSLLAAAAVALGAATAVAGPAAAAAPAPAAAAAAVSGTLSVTNPDVLPRNDLVMFNKIQNPADANQRFHSKVALRLKNTGTNPLTVRSLTTSGLYSVSSPYALPFTLTSGAFVDVTVTFTATTGTWALGNLAIGSTSSTGTANISLHGFWQKYSEHNLEPRAQDLAYYLGYKTVMPSSMYSRGAYQAFSSDEVLTPYWTRSSTASATITALAGWRGYPSQNVVKTHPKGASTSLSTIYTGLQNDAQSIIPRNSAWARGTASFSTSGTFGFRLDNEYGNPALNSQSSDRAAGCTATQCGHHVRVFKARDGSNNLVPNTYLLFEDIQGINFDFQDNVYLIHNVKPAS